MPNIFTNTTAELVIQVVEAVQINKNTTIELIQDFCDISNKQASNALKLAQDLMLIKSNNNFFEPLGPLVKFISTPNDKRKASILRIALESYKPFVIFRERLSATGSVDTAAQQTKTMLDLDAHREEIKDTLISLGTYTNALFSKGGGQYDIVSSGIENVLSKIAEGATELSTSEYIIRNQIGNKSNDLDRNDIILPLSQALIRANAGDSINAVSEASRAIESFIYKLSIMLNVELSGASGINQKLAKFRSDNKLPKKIVEAAKYLGQIRNAADHGIDADPDVGEIWNIQKSTGLEYVFVTCSFIASVLERKDNGRFII